MTKTKAIALFVIVAGTLLYLKSVLYPPVPPWEAHNQAGMTAYQEKNYPEAEKQFKTALAEAEKFSIDDWRLTLTLENLAEIYRLQSKFPPGFTLFETVGGNQRGDLWSRPSQRGGSSQ